jgi:hypothetical protein
MPMPFLGVHAVDVALYGLQDLLVLHPPPLRQAAGRPAVEGEGVGPFHLVFRRGQGEELLLGQVPGRIVEEAR